MGTDQRVVIERLDEVIRDRIEGVRSALAALCSTDSVRRVIGWVCRSPGIEYRAFEVADGRMHTVFRPA